MVKPAPDPRYLSDSLRDAYRYRQLVSELAEAAQYFHPEGEPEGFSLEEALARMLPRLCEALNGETAFMAEVKEDTGVAWLEVTASYPGRAHVTRRLPWTPLFEKLSIKQRSWVAARIQPETVSGLELFGATSAVLVRVNLTDKQRIIGICNRRKPYLGPFLAADRMILESLTDLFTAGIEIGERRRQELENIQKTALRISSEHTLEELLPEIARNAGQVFRAPVSLMLWDETHSFMQIRASHGLSSAYSRQSIPRARLEAGLARMGDNLSIVSADLRTEPGEPALITGEGHYAALSALLKVGDHLLGLLNIYSKDPDRRFDKHDMELAEIFASQAAIGIRNASLHKRVVEDGKTAASLVAKTVDLQEMVKFLIDDVADELHAEAVGLGFLKEGETSIRFTASRGLSAEFCQGWKISPAEVKERTCQGGYCQPRIIPDLAAEPFGPDALNRAERVVSALVVPLSIEGRLAGLLVVYSKDAPRRFDPVDLEVLQMFVYQAVNAIQAAQAYERVRAARDELTRVLEVVSTIGHAQTAEEGTAALANHLVDWLKVTFCHIFTFDERENVLLKGAAFPIHRQLPLEWDPDRHGVISLKSSPVMKSLLELPGPAVFRKDDAVDGVCVLDHFRKILGIEHELCEVLVMVMRLDKRTLGICTLGEMRDRPESRFTPEKIYQANTMAGQAAALILRLQMHETSERRAEREVQLRKAGELITQNATLPAGQLTGQIARMVCDILGAHCAVVYPYYDALGVYDVHAIGSYGLAAPGKAYRSKSREESSGIGGFVLKRHARLVVDDVSSGWDRDQLMPIDLDRSKFLRRENIQSFVALRLQIEQEPVGALFVNFRAHHHFTTAELDILQIFASQAAVAINQARLFQRGQKEHQAIESMNRITRMIGIKTTPKPILEKILRDALAITGRGRCGRILQLLPDGITFQVILQAGYGREVLNQTFQSRLFQRIAQEWEVRLILDLRERPPEDALVGEGENPHGRIRSLLAAPFTSAGRKEPDCLVVLESSEPSAFSPDDKAILEDLAVYAGIALQSTRHYAQARENNRLQSSLLEASQEIMALEYPNTSATVLKKITESIRAVLHCDLVTLHTYDEERQEINPGPITAGDLKHEEKLIQDTTLINRTIAGQLIRAGRPHFSPDTQADRMLRKSRFVRSEKVRSSAGIPLVVGTEKLGILFVNYRELHEFTPQEKKIIRLFAGQAALALHNARMFDRLNTKNRHLEKVHDASKLIINSVSQGREKIMFNILREAVETVTGTSGVKATAGTIQLYKEGTLVFESVYPEKQPGQNGVVLTLDADEAVDGRIGITGRAFLTGEPQLVMNVHKDPHYRVYSEETCSELAVPLFDGGQAIGVLNVESDRYNGFDLDDQEALVALADLAVIALHNAERAEQLSRVNAVAIMGAWGADITHDINREVGNIRRAIMQLQMRPDLDEEVLRRIEKIDGYAEAMGLMKLPGEAGVDPEGEATYSRREIDSILQQLTGSLAAKHPRVQLSFEGGAPGAKVLMHEQWIRRILRHLVTNAVRECLKAPLQPEQPRIQVRSSFRGGFVEVEVDDNGPGVPPEHVNRLFKEPLPSKGQGGRGLLLVQFLVEHHGGAIRLAQKNGPGARFVFTLKEAHNQ